MRPLRRQGTDGGDRESIEKLLKDALRIAPDSVYVRQRYLQAIDPRWHGTAEEINDAPKAIDASSLPQNSKRFIRYETLLRLGGASLTAKDYERAANSYRAAAPYCVLSEPWEALANL